MACDNSNKIVKIFEEDEMVFMKVHHDWTREELLAQNGLFFLKDICGPLEITPARVKNKVTEIRAGEASPWSVMGIRKVWSHWIVRMTVFAPFYRKYFQDRTRAIPREWDGNILLRSGGRVSADRRLPFHSVHAPSAPLSGPTTSAFAPRDRYLERRRPRLLSRSNGAVFSVAQRPLGELISTASAGMGRYCICNQMITTTNIWFNQSTKWER